MSKVIRTKLSFREIATRQMAQRIAYAIEETLIPRMGKGFATVEMATIVTQLYITMNLLKNFAKRGRLQE